MPRNLFLKARHNEGADEKTSNLKYEITDITHEEYPFLHRIRALQDVGDQVKAGDLGGFVEGESNLATDPSNCAWIFDDAIAAGNAYREMMKTKLETGRLDKRQCYHIIQSFKPGEITPELALEIAKAFAQEHLDGFEVVIGTHVDRHHIHSHIVFNSVNADTGEKYHSTMTAQTKQESVQQNSEKTRR